MQTVTASHSPRPVRLSDLRTLPPTLTIPEAGRIGWGFSRPTAYQMHQRGEFPCPVLRIGSRFFVRTADLARALGIEPADLLTEV